MNIDEDKCVLCLCIIPSAAHLSFVVEIQICVVELVIVRVIDGQMSNGVVECGGKTNEAWKMKMSRGS